MLPLFRSKIPCSKMLCYCQLLSLYQFLSLPAIICIAMTLFTFEYCSVQYSSSLSSVGKNKNQNPAQNLDDDLHLGIINGKAVEEDLWPFMASLMFNRRSHFCGGTLFTPKYILTSAHCMFFQNGTPIPVEMITAYIGHTSIIHLDHFDMFTIAEKIPHPRYTNVTKGYDIGLLRLAEPINFTRRDYIQCTCKPDVPLSEVSPTRCYVIGWGTRYRLEPERYSSKLQDARLPLLDESYCTKVLDVKYRNLPKGSVLCAGYEDGEKDSCSGDSGGPLMCAVTKEKPFVYQQVGVVSFGQNCSLPKNPGYYTRVDHYRDWIKSVTKC